MASAEILLPVVVGSLGLATIETVVIILARRDVNLGMKKWLLKKFGRRPLKVRLYGPDMTVKEHIIGTAGRGESLNIEKGIYFLRKKAIRKSDDDVNEINFSYKNVLPFNPDDPADETVNEDLDDEETIVLRKLREKAPLTKEEKEILLKISKEGDPEKKPWLTIRSPFKKKEGEEEAPEEENRDPVDPEDAPKGTNPNLLDKFVEYVYLAAKAEALKGLDGIEKWIKGAAIAAAAAAIIGWMIYSFVKGDLTTHVEAVKTACQATASACLSGAKNATIINL